jgi:hypothetical protein
MASSNTSMERLSQAILSMFRLASVFVHFHSFSCVATLTSSMTRGTQPPKTNILDPIMVAE